MIESVDICVCTYKRPQIVAALESLADITVTKGVKLRIIVSDNDETPSAKALVSSISMPFEVTYIHAPSHNISIARNACLEAATADAIVFIDDDETVTKEWMVELIKTQHETGAEVVIGPADAVYPNYAPSWIVDGNYHSFTATYVRGEIQTASTCNVLFLRTDPAVCNKRFRLHLGKTGGEDMIFFSEIFRDGGRFAYAPNAVVKEVVEPGRLSLRWLLERKLRSGQTIALAALDQSGTGFVTRSRVGGSAILKLVFCVIMAGANAIISHKRRRWLIRGALHAGVLSKCLGVREKATYGV